MSEKILIVDDSLTIQKVVNITLANSGYQLTAAHDEQELFSSLEKESFSLILLDFNLSEEKSGYELAKKIKESAPTSSILAMVGTFDSIDEQSLSDAGVNDSIVKPFESTKFVTKCNDLINQTATNEPSNSVEADSSDTNDDEEWEINTSTNTSIDLGTIPKDLDVNETKSTSSLRDEIEGWGITMPDVIEAAEIANEMDSHGILPPQIDHDGQDDIIISMPEEIEDNLLFPESNSTDDLSDPSIQSRLISLDDLSLSDDFLDEKMEQVGEESIVREFSSSEEDDFWAVDDEVLVDIEDEGISEASLINIKFTSEEGSLSEEVGPKLEDISSDSSSLVESIALEVIERLKPMLNEIIEEKIKDVSKEIVERVAWEAIPDLAENLIRSEVKDISKKIQDKHSL
jgi:DNA-binding response OmpR family regulator